MDQRTAVVFLLLLALVVSALAASAIAWSRRSARRAVASAEQSLAEVRVELAAQKQTHEALLVSERHWRRTIDALPQLVWTATADGVANYCSPYVAALTGLPESQLVGSSFFDVIHPDERESARKAWFESVTEQREYQAEHRFRRSDGVYRRFTCRGTPVRDDAGDIVQWVGIATDVTERANLEEQLVKANRHLELIMQLSEAALWSFTLKDRSVRNAYVSEADRIRLDRIDTTKMTGFVQGMESLSTPPGDQQVLSNAIQACVDGETPEFQCEYRILRGDGAVRWRQARGIALRAPDGTPTGFMATSIDVTDLKRAEEEARTIKERLELALRKSQVITFDLEIQGGSVGSSPFEGYNLWGVRGREVALPPPDFSSVVKLVVAPEDQDRLNAAIQACVSGETPEFLIEYRSVGYEDGSSRWRLARGMVVRDADGAPLRFVGASLDITHLKRVEEERCLATEQLRESEQRWRGLAETLPHLVWTADCKGTIDYLSAQATAYTGLTESELLDAGWADAVHPDDREYANRSWAEAVERKQAHEVQHRIRGADGEYRWFTNRGAPARDSGGRIFEMVWDLHGHLELEAARSGPAPCQGGRRVGKPREGRISGEREPRDSHADERDPRHDRAGARLRKDSTPETAALDGQIGCQEPAQHHQRPARLLEDRGGQAHAG